MDGIGNQEGWRWIFLLEGLATVVMGVAVFFLLPDSPAHAAGRWLTETEARFLRLNHAFTRGIPKPTIDGEVAKKKVDWKLIWSVIKDYQIYLQAIVLYADLSIFCKHR
jgi:hypothetical protein